MVALSVNINKIALIRNSRLGDNPNLLTYAQHCIEFGAHGITVHPRPDQRHIRAQDCAILKKALSVELNIEGNPYAGFMASQREDVSDYPGFMAIVKDVLPAQCTLVPDSNQQLTSDHGFNLKSDTNALQDIIETIKSLGIRVSLFMDPDCEQISLAQQIGADRIELYTGPYADSHDKACAFHIYKTAAEHALTLDLGINAGHDLNLDNLPLFAKLPGLQEVSIGHALTIDALHFGLQDTIRRYLSTLNHSV
jgi:pyridoxine 5-phosphate synthase